MDQGNDSPDVRPIFQLRKEGPIEEALSKARDMGKEHPRDPWVNRALAWCLYDAIKGADRNGDDEAREVLLEEFLELDLPGDDEILLERRNSLLRWASQQGRDLKRATELSKAGDHGDAVRLARKYARKTDAGRETVLCYAWILYRKVKSSDASSEARERIWCFEELQNLWNEDWEPEIRLARAFLIYAIQHGKDWPNFVDFIEHSPVGFLSPPVFEEAEEKGDFDPLREQLVKGVYQALKKFPRIRRGRDVLVQWLQGWCEGSVQNEWTPYYAGRILAWCGGNLELSRQLLIQVVAKNTDDFWRWQALSEVAGSEREQLMFLSRAVSCRSGNEELKMGLFRNYSEALAAAGRIDEACASRDEALRLYQLAGKESKDPEPSWYQPPNKSTDRRKQLFAFAGDHGRDADAILRGHLRESIAVFQRVLPKRTEEDRTAYLYWCSELGMRRLRFRGKSPGADSSVIRIWYSENEGKTCKVLSWEPTELPVDVGSTFDTIVEHINKEKKIAALIGRRIPKVLLHFDRWPAAADLEPWTCVRVQLVLDEKGRPLALDWNTMPARREFEGFMEEFSGVFTMPPGKSFGFVQTASTSIFVPPPLAAGNEEEKNLRVLALHGMDKQGKPGWKAVKVL